MKRGIGGGRMRSRNRTLAKFTNLCLELLVKGRPLHEKVTRRIIEKGLSVNIQDNYLYGIRPEDVMENLKCSLSTAYDYCAALRELAGVLDWNSMS